MSDLSLTVRLDNAVQGRIAVKEQLLPHIGGHLQAGRALVVDVRFAEDVKTDEQRGYYHVILEFIAQHGRANGKQFPMPVWKEFFRDKFLGFKVRTFVDPMTGRKVRRRVRVSTEDLGVRGYGNLIEKVTAFASTDLGLTVPPPRRREVVDAETGEILREAA